LFAAVWSGTALAAERYRKTNTGGGVFLIAWRFDHRSDSAERTVRQRCRSDQHDQQRPSKIHRVLYKRQQTSLLQAVTWALFNDVYIKA